MSETDKTSGIAAESLRQHVERIERLEEERKAVSEDIKQVYGEAKSMGFDVKILRKVVSIRKLADNERREQEDIMDIYKSALGME